MDRVTNSLHTPQEALINLRPIHGNHSLPTSRMNKFSRLLLVLLMTVFSVVPAWAAQLSVVNVQEIRTVDLTSEGNQDWMHFGLGAASDINRKTGVAPQLAYSLLSSAPNRFGHNPATRSTQTWTDGAPTLSEAGFAGGIYFAPRNAGYTITAPASTQTRVLTLHTGGFNANGQLVLSLSDSSAAPVTINMSGATVHHHTITVTYSAASSGQTLSAVHRHTNSTGNIALQAATLFATGGNQPPVLGAIGNRSANIGSPLVFNVSATDADGPAPLVLDIESAVPALPPGASFTDNGGGTGVFSWTPSAGQEGLYVVTFRARDNGGAGLSDTEAVQISVTGLNGPMLDVSAPTVAPFNNSLTDEGTDDWMHFGLVNAASVNRKAFVPAQLAFSVLGGSASRFTGSVTTRPSHSWTDGTPTAGHAGFPGGIFFSANNSSFRLTAPADTGTRVLKVHLGGNATSAQLSVSLSDGSQPPFVTTLSGAGLYHNEVTVNYRAASAGQTVILTFSKTVNGGNIALQSASLALVQPPPSLPLSDDFNDGIFNGWTVVNESVRLGAWQIQNQELRQLNKVEAASARVATYQLGSFARLNAGSALTDYRFSVTAQILSTELAEDIGVMFRYLDPHNYYRLSLNGRWGYTRFEKKVGGVFSTLAVNSRGYRPGEVLNIVIEARGVQLYVWVNGDPLFAVQDGSLSQGTIALYAKHQARFDNVSLVALGTAPTVIISSPKAYSTTDASTLSVSALAANVPSGGAVRFLLNGGSQRTDSTVPYTASFTNVPPGNHDVTAELIDASGQVVASDTNVLVGANGELIAGVGDSITNGIGDLYATDNISVLERFVGFEGNQASLTTNLDATRGGLTPTLVFNEGIGGDEAFDAAFLRIDSILERLPDVDRIIIGLGTNDAFVPVPSGLGCNGNACTGTFKGNMQTLVNKIVWADYPANTVPSNIQVMVSLAPPEWTTATPWTSAANNLIRQYNTVVSTELTGITLGPNFFNYFMPSSALSTHRETLFNDTLHPNGLGHEVMSVLWHNAIEPASPLPLPMVLEALDLSVADEPRQDLIEVGDFYRTTTTHTITSLPAALTNGRWIRTPNNTGNKSKQYIKFQADRSVDVYIAYDGGATARPNWMSGFTNTGLSVGTTDPNGPVMNLYVRTYPAGLITLGGNKSAGAVGVNTNYIAIVVEN